MVKIFLIAMTLILTSNYSMATVEPLNADSLKNRIYAKDKEKRDAKARLKLMRGNSGQLQYLQERQLFYTLPNGKKVIAVLLPSGKKSPAVVINKKPVPACLTTSGRLVSGLYNDVNGLVECDIPDAELALIDDAIYQKKVVAETKPTPKKDKAKIDKYGDSKNESKQVPSKPRKPNPKKKNSDQVKKEPTSNPYIYVPPAGVAAQTKSQGFALEQSNDFGIPLGTWAEIRLERTVSSADSGSIEFVLAEPLVGEYKTLEAGTLLFASKQINVANRKLEANIIKALTPDGEEIDGISGWVYSSDKTAGLAGRLERDRTGEAKSASVKAGLKGLSAVSATGAVGIGSTVVDSYTADMINNEKRYAPNTPSAIIRVSPQRGLVKFSSTF